MKKTKMDPISIHLLDKQIRIVESTNQSLKGLEGTIMYETKNMMVIDTTQGPKKIIKQQVKFIIKGQEQSIIDGATIQKRPEDRIR